MRGATVFVDRDGVINANRADHVLDWGQFEFLPGVLDALAMLAAAGLPVIVVTNQAAVARGLLSVHDLAEMHRRMAARIRAAGGDVLDVLYCPHDAAARCDCRKPKPGLFFQAARLHDIDPAASYYVGDALTDIQAGQAAGCTCILVRTGRGRPQHLRDEARFSAVIMWPTTFGQRHGGSSPRKAMRRHRGSQRPGGVRLYLSRPTSNAGESSTPSNPCHMQPTASPAQALIGSTVRIVVVPWTHRLRDPCALNIAAIVMACQGLSSA